MLHHTLALAAYVACRPADVILVLYPNIPALIAVRLHVLSVESFDQFITG